MELKDKIMPKTYEPIASQTLGSAAATVTFSSISGTYTDLILISQAQNTGGTWGTFNVRVNGDSGTNYSRTYMYGNGSSTGSGRQINTTESVIGTIPASSGGFFTLVKINFMNYSNTTTNKTFICTENDVSNAATATVNLWRNTAAITSIAIFSSVGNLATGSTFTLYGIKAA
jgi:hypothetical protein